MHGEEERKASKSRGKNRIMWNSVLTRFIFPPAPSYFLSAISAISYPAFALIAVSEIKGKHLQYSKFWNIRDTSNQKSHVPKQIELSSRTGMLLAYTPAFLAGVFSFLFFPHDNIRVLLLESALILHFFKRIFEVLFIHKYSSKMILDSAILISMSYCLSTATMIYAQVLSQDFAEPLIDLKYPGIGLFLIGISGNFYHHYILSRTRKEGEKAYKIPKGGLFGLVICPHYLFEIIDLFGIALIAQTLYAFNFALGSAIYLWGRSYATRRWYVSKFEDFPKHVKSLVPFVF